MINSGPSGRGLSAMKMKPRIGITMGDPAGVGPELCLRALADPEILRRCVPVLFGDITILQRVASVCELHVPAYVRPLAEWTEQAPGDEAERDEHPCVIDVAAVDGDNVVPGRVQAACGRAAHLYIMAAVDAAVNGLTAAVVTAPIHKEALHLAGVPFPGHTELLAALTHTEHVCMMLASDAIKVSLVTIHAGYAEVPELLSIENVRRTIEMTAGALRRMNRAEPRITVCALNPHAGEHGLFGDEEQTIITPAVAAARAAGLNVDGPLPPDTAFLPAQREQTDAFVAMYHDQGLIPFKMLAFDQGVNITLGLPIIRTSVDHGTAFDIAWQGRASPNSLVQATLWSARLGACRT